MVTFCYKILLYSTSMFGLVWLNMGCRVVKLVRAVHLQTLFEFTAFMMT